MILHLAAAGELVALLVVLRGRWLARREYLALLNRVRAVSLPQL